MSEYTATVTEFTERPAGQDSVLPAITLGGIVVKPPIKVGERFRAAVLGQESIWVNVEEVVTTDEATILLAESGRGGDVEARRADIRLIANRIGELANAPETTVIQMIDQSPFPGPEDPEDQEEPEDPDDWYTRL